MLCAHFGLALSLHGDGPVPDLDFVNLLIENGLECPVGQIGDPAEGMKHFLILDCRLWGVLDKLFDFRQI